MRLVYVHYGPTGPPGPIAPNAAWRAREQSVHRGAAAIFSMSEVVKASLATDFRSVSSSAPRGLPDGAVFHGRARLLGAAGRARSEERFGLDRATALMLSHIGPGRRPDAPRAS